MKKASLVAKLPDEPTLRPAKVAERRYADLNFKVSPDFKREFKVAAAQSGLKQNELLIECFRLWQANRKKS